jgi:hypothetical protein
MVQTTQTDKPKRQRKPLSKKEMARRAAEHLKKQEKAKLTAILNATPDRLVERGERDGIPMAIWKVPATGRFYVVASGEIGAARVGENLTLGEAR